jgi:hypothetical protein
MSDDGRNRAVMGGKVFRDDLSVLSWPDTLSNATDASGALIQINLEHSKIHQGKGWNVNIEIASIALSASHYILFRVVSGNSHLRSYGVTVSDSPATIRLYEGPTVTTVGTEAAPRNRKRSASDTNGVLVYSGSTISNDGTLLETDYLPTGGNKSGGNANSFYEEWILDPGDYVLKITNGSNNSVQAYVHAFWYA